MTVFDYAYSDMLKRILDIGIWNESRGFNYIELINYQLTISQSSDPLRQHQLPLAALELRKVPIMQAIGEALWMFQGHTDIETLNKYGCHFWDDLFKTDGVTDVDYLYGNYIRGGGVFDQLAYLIDGLKEPGSNRRLYMNLTNLESFTTSLPSIVPPCITSVQVIKYNVRGIDWFDMIVTMRSSDVIIGLPNDIIAFNVLAAILQYATGVRYRVMHFNLASAHIYENLIGTAEKLLAIPALSSDVTLRVRDLELLTHLSTDKFLEVFDESITPDSFEIENYNPKQDIKLKQFLNY